MGALKALGSGLQKIGRALTLAVGPALLPVTWLTMRGIKGAVDLAAMTSAYWIKNNFTGQSTLFGAATALTSFSETLGQWNKACTKFLWSGYSDAFDYLGTTISDKMNDYGWGTTGNWNDDNNDRSDIAIHQGEKEFKKHNKRIRERYEDKTAAISDHGSESRFDRAKIKTESWLESAKRLLEEAREAFGSSATDGVDEFRAKQDALKEWLKQTQTDEDLKSILHIINRNNLATAFGVETSLAQRAKDFLTQFENIGNIDPREKELFYAGLEARREPITDAERTAKNGGQAVIPDKDKARINKEIYEQREAAAQAAYTAMTDAERDALHIEDQIRLKRDEKSLALIDVMISKTEIALEKTVEEAERRHPKAVIQNPSAKRVGAVSDRTPLLSSGG